jgi:hypothetical protein
VSTSTTPEPVDLRALRRARLGRRAFVVVLTAFLVLGALGVYGVRTAEVSAAAGGYELAVKYATVSRSGLATPWSVELRRDGGFGQDTVTLAADAGYFDIFDENGFDPEPLESRTEGDRIVWTFRAPEGDTLTVDFDARIEPAVQLTRAEGRVSLVGADAPLAVTFSTFVMP